MKKSRMKGKRSGRHQISRGSFISIICYCIGIVISIVYVFIPIKKGQLFDGSEGCLPVKLMFGDDMLQTVFFDNISPILTAAVTFWIPMILVVGSAVVFIRKPYSRLGTELGLAGVVFFIMTDITFILRNADFAGIFVNIAGIAVMLVSWIAYNIMRDDVIEDEIYYSEQFTQRINEYGTIMCIGGEYAGAKFIFEEQIIIGKNSESCNLIIANNRTISRKHCIIKYKPMTGTYTVKDLSKNGTFLADGRVCAKKSEVQVESGTEIYMGEPRERFVLGEMV